MRTIYFFVKLLAISVPVAVIFAYIEFAQTGDSFVVWKYGFFALIFCVFGVLLGNLNKIAVKENGVYLFRGVFGSPLGTLAAPFEIIEKVEIKQGFFERIFGLYSIDIWFKTMSLNKRIGSYGLTKEEALNLQNAILIKIKK